MDGTPKNSNNKNLVPIGLYKIGYAIRRALRYWDPILHGSRDRATRFVALFFK